MLSLRKNKNLLLAGMCVFLMAGLSSCSFEDIEYVKLNNYTINKASGDETQITLNVRLNNPNKYTVRITKTNLNLTVGGKDAGKVDLVEKIKLKKSTEDDYDVVIAVDSKKIGNAVMQSGLSILLTKKAIVRVKGWIKGKAYGVGAKVDIDESHEIDASKLKF